MAYFTARRNGLPQVYGAKLKEGWLWNTLKILIFYTTNWESGRSFWNNPWQHHYNRSTNLFAYVVVSDFLWGTPPVTKITGFCKRSILVTLSTRKTGKTTFILLQLHLSSGCGFISLSLSPAIRLPPRKSTSFVHSSSDGRCQPLEPNYGCQINNTRYKVFHKSKLLPQSCYNHNEHLKCILSIQYYPWHLAIGSPLRKRVTFRFSAIQYLVSNNNGAVYHYHRYQLPYSDHIHSLFYSC